MDIQIRDDAGQMTVQPRLSVYVRALPTSEELFARNGRLLPRADFNDAARQHIRDEIARRASQSAPADNTPAGRAAWRADIMRDVYGGMGVSVPAGAQLPSGDEREIDGDNGIDPSPVLNGRLQIPDRHSRRYDIPQKWIRLQVEAPAFALVFPCEPHRWEAAASDYKTLLLEQIRRTYVNWLETPFGQENAWRKMHPPSEAFWSAERWDMFLNAARRHPPVPVDIIPIFDAHVLVQALQDPLHSGQYSVRIALENLRETDSDFECGLFSVGLEVRIPSHALRPMRLERVRRSYHLAGFMTMPGIGVNGGIVDKGTAGNERVLDTTWMPRYVLPRMTATQVETVPTSYEELARESLDLLALHALPTAMAAWIELTGRTTSLSAPGEEGTASDEAGQRARFQDDLAAWEREQERITRGIEILTMAQAAWRSEPGSAEAIPYRAWLLLNRTFLAANPQIHGQAPRGWRLFQLAFVLTHIPTLASRLAAYHHYFDASFDEDAASLLYMSTGGGKTEAFFGTVVYALFLDRLRGKQRGVTAMMHYPLRLLTVQQAQRLGKLMARAELVRRNEGLGGSPFEIGFWVGGGNTPNSTERRIGELEEQLRCVPAWNDPRGQSEHRLLNSDDRIDREYAAARESWNKIPSCPFCGSEEGTGLRLFPSRHNRLGIVCFNTRCDWNALYRPAGSEPLPFLLVDTDIYRRAPSVLLGTIDKLALLGQSTTTIDRIAGMFGLARWIEGGADGLLRMPSGPSAGDAPPAGCQRVSPAYRQGVEVFFDPFPSLIVQDEMHLLEESLGTFGGIFETGLFAWLSRLSGLLGDRVCRIPGAPDRPRLPHIIGATATAADAAKHTRALYQRSVVQFPHPGPALHGGFYTRMATFLEGGVAAVSRESAQLSPLGRERSAPWGRVYASLMTNGRLHTVTTLSVLAAHAATITRWERDLASTDLTRSVAAANEIEDHISSENWGEQRRSAVRQAAADRQFARLASLVDLHRIELTYVTNKKGGDQLLSALDGEVREAHAKMGSRYELTKFEMKLISGGVDIGGIQEVIRAAERPFDPMHDDIADALRGIVATSAISHGVDVEAFNAMAFAGMPSDIAEYIQASSRVGRTHVGFSLLIPTPQTRRDRFVVEVHESFHRLLERMISAPAIERWADKAIERTIPSLVQTWVAGVRHQERFVALDDSHKGQFPVPTTVEAFDRILKDRAQFDDCVAFVMSAIGISARTGRPSNPEYYRDLVRNAAARIRASVGSGEFVGKLGDFWSNPLSGMQRPMTSLRDVDASGRIRASAQTQRNEPLTKEQVGEAMAIVRNRGVERLRRTATSELDGDI